MDPNKITIIEDDQPPSSKSTKPLFSKRMEDAPVANTRGSSASGNPSTATYAKWGAIACVTIIGIVLIIIIGGRAMTGYSVYTAMTEQGSVPLQYVTDMNGLANAKAAAEAEAASAQAAANDAQAALESELEKITREREAYATEKATLESDLETTRDTANELAEELAVKREAFEDSSRRLCCIQRVLDPKITGYAITTDGTVACVTDGSGTDISC